MKKFIKFILFLFLVFIIVMFGYYYFPEKKLQSGCKIDKILVEKRKRRMHIYYKTNLLKTYKISLGSHPIGAKRRQGDRKTPEGTYTIDSKTDSSDFYKNLGISYPNQNDIAYAKKNDIKDIGGAIKIHGLPNGYGFVGKFHRFYDWTAGCIAVTNKEIEELKNNITIGTVIVISE